MEAQALTQFFNRQNNECYFWDSTNYRWGLKKEQSDFSLKERVTFGSEGQLISESVSGPYSLYQGFDCIQPIIHKAFHQMAQKMGWKNESRSMAVTFMQHQIEQKAPGIEFHRDDSHYTLVCMLDDPEQMGWHGGDFQFRSETAKKISYQIKPLIGQGILFSNQGTQNSVTPIRCKSERAQRTIMAIHDYGSFKEIHENSEQKISDRVMEFFFTILNWV